MIAQKRDSGLYKCKAKNTFGQKSAVLVVVELPQFRVAPPARLQVNQQRNITVPCQASGDPQPTVTWVKENGSLPFGRSKVSSDGTGFKFGTQKRKILVHIPARPRQMK